MANVLRRDPKQVMCELATKGPPLVAVPAWPFSLPGCPAERVGMEAGDAQPVVRFAVTDAHVVVLVDVDRLEQCLIAQPAVRVIGVGAVPTMRRR